MCDPLISLRNLKLLNKQIKIVIAMPLLNLGDCQFITWLSLEFVISSTQRRGVIPPTICLS